MMQSLKIKLLEMLRDMEQYGYVISVRYWYVVWPNPSFYDIGDTKNEIGLDKFKLFQNVSYVLKSRIVKLLCVG